MSPKEFSEGRRRLAEISFTVMIAAPAASFIVSKEDTQATLAWGIMTGLASCLIFLTIAFILARRWK